MGRTLGGVELLRLELTGTTGQVETPPGSPPRELGLLGVDVDTTTIDDTDYVVVQVLFDDDIPGFDRSLLDCPMVAELFTAEGGLVLRELLDHDRFRRDLRDDREAGRDELRGVLVFSGGELPPDYVRLAFLEVDIAGTAATTLVVRRVGVEELRSGVEVAHARGELTDGQRRSLLLTIEQRHPG